MPISKADQMALRRDGFTQSMIDSIGAFLDGHYTRFTEDMATTIELIAPTRVGVDGADALREMAQIIRKAGDPDNRRLD